MRGCRPTACTGPVYGAFALLLPGWCARDWLEKFVVVWCGSCVVYGC